MKLFFPDPAKAAIYDFSCKPATGNSSKDQLVLLSFPFEGLEKVPKLTWGALVEGLMGWVGWVSAGVYGDTSCFIEPYWILPPRSLDTALALTHINLAEYRIEKESIF